MARQRAAPLVSIVVEEISDAKCANHSSDSEDDEPQRTTKSDPDRAHDSDVNHELISLQCEDAGFRTRATTYPNPPSGKDTPSCEAQYTSASRRVSLSR